MNRPGVGKILAEILKLWPRAWSVINRARRDSGIVLAVVSLVLIDGAEDGASRLRV
jgi:hypothetical protein